MKKTLLVQFIFFSQIISGLQVSAITFKNTHDRLLISHFGLVSFNSAKNDNPSCIPAPLNRTKYFEYTQGQQYVGQAKSIGIRDLDETIGRMQSSSDFKVVSEGQHLQSLAYDLHPTLYIRNGNLSNPDGSAPKCVDIDASSVWKLYEDNLQFSEVELITIRIEQPGDLAIVVNLANFQGFTNLKYLCILSTFEICFSPGCVVTMISPMVQGTDGSEALILYKVSIPE